ncbi:MAG: hypothetical protein B6241_13550 [Spirochaetaceae bacterium 4572_59]|nr:MAG: hypothetical protein B6241_13550 [Spirochaetaceae bacterium 4572_59]
MKLLIVDDSKVARMLIRSIIAEYDNSIEICEASNGLEATEVQKKESPDLTFLDLTMPVMDGFEALRIIKENNINAVVIVLTADIQKKSVEKCMEMGAYKVLKKLPRKEEIHQILNTIRNR